jgi:hypothetical protein
MKAPSFHRGRSAMVLLCIALIALFLSAVIVRLPAAWSLVPVWPTDVLMRFIQPTGQEAAAEVEFLGIWLVCFGTIGAGWVATFALRKLFQGGRANEHVV